MSLSYFTNRAFNPNSSRSSWTSDSTVSLSFKVGQPSKVEVGEPFSLIVGAVGAKCIKGHVCASTATKTRNLAFATSSSALVNVVIQPPALVLYPTVVLSLPSELSSCNNLTVDLSASTGAGGRFWQNVTFKVSATNGDDSLRSYLNSHYNYVTNTVLVPRPLLSSGTYDITATVQNFFGNTAYKSSSVIVTGRGPS